MASNYRDLFPFVVPSWLSTGDGGKFLYAMARLKDAYKQWARCALEARMPSRVGDSALALLGADRGIPRGRAELPANYAARLVAWRSPRGHRTRGTAYALLGQVSAYFGGLACWTVDLRGNRYDRTLAGVESGSAQTWNWDGTTSPLFRFWLVLKPAGAFAYVLEDVRAIRGLFAGDNPWKPGGTRAEWAIVSLSGTDPAPDGAWLNWSKNVGGTQVQARDPAFAYWSMAPGINNLYAGNPANFPTLITECGGGTYAGNPANFPALLSLPSGASYAGDPTNYPSTIQLFDDGDLV